MIIAAVEVISGPCGQPEMLLVEMEEVCVSAVSSAARTGVWNISVHASPRAIRPLYNLFDFINLYSHYISYLKVSIESIISHFSA